MKLTTTHVALLAVLMYGLSSAACLLGEAPTVAEPSSPPATPAVAPAAGTPQSAPATTRPTLPPAPTTPSVILRPVFASDEDQKPDDQLKILELENADANTTAQQLSSVMPQNLTIVPDSRTNSIIIRGKPEACKEAEALVMKLDQTETKNSNASPAPKTRYSFGDRAPAKAILVPSTATLVAPSGATISAGNGTATMVSPGELTVNTGIGGGVGSSNLTVSGTGGGSSAAAMVPGLEIHTFHLSHANSNDVYNALMTVFKAVLSKPGARASWNLSSDKHTNDLIVAAPKEDFPQIDALITQFDSPNPSKLTIDVARDQADALKALSNADAVLQQAQSAQQIYNDVLQQIQTLPTDKQQQFQKALQQFQDIQRRLGDQTAAQAKLREDVARRDQELRKRYEELARRNTEDAEQLAKDQALQQHINALANDIRALTAKAGKNPSDQQKSEIDATTNKLKDALSHQFDDQQKGESNELQQLRQRLEKLEKEISDRAQNRDNVIQRRLDDLISSAVVSLPNSGTMPVRITTPQLILKNVPGSGTLQFDTVTPGTITITQPSANPHGETQVPDEVKLNDSTTAASSIPPAATGSVFEVHITGPKVPRVGDEIELKLKATNRGQVNTPVLRIIDMTIDGLVLDRNRTTEIGALTPGESKEQPLNFRVNRAGKINFSAKVLGEGVPATATYSAEAKPADSSPDQHDADPATGKER